MPKLKPLAPAPSASMEWIPSPAWPWVNSSSQPNAPKKRRSSLSSPSSAVPRSPVPLSASAMLSPSWEGIRKPWRATSRYWRSAPACLRPSLPPASRSPAWEESKRLKRVIAAPSPFVPILPPRGPISAASCASRAARPMLRPPCAAPPPCVLTSSPHGSTSPSSSVSENVPPKPKNASAMPSR